jgi:hypothetical protein
MKRAAIWLCWGERYLELAARCAAGVHIDRYLICPPEDLRGDIEMSFTGVIPVTDLARNMLDKSRVPELLPSGYDSFVYLDTDTRVLGDISFAFEKAEQHGIAVAPAPHYNLSQFFGFGRILDALGEPRADQMQYNAGVIFFSPTERVKTVFRRWRQLCTETKGFLENDQPFLTLAMEQSGFLPYVLSPAYNFRGNSGDLLVGGVRIWHNSAEPPSDLNTFDAPWPPRAYRGGERI